MENRMKLYEICDGRIGCSYQRSYIWADSDLQAEELFKKKNPTREIKTKRILLYASSPPFATEMNDEGFPEPLV